MVIIGATTDLGRAALSVVAGHRIDFLVDGLSDDGTDARRLAELALEFTPLRLGITDDYAVAAFWAERDDLNIDRGLVDWEAAEVEVVAGPSAPVEVAGLPADIAVVGLAGEAGRQAAAAALAAGTQVVLVSAELAGDGFRPTSESSINYQLLALAGRDR